MAINFPTSPAVNQQYTFSNKTWVYDGAAWNLNVTPGWISPVVYNMGNQTGSITVDWTGRNVITMTLTGNATITNTNAVNGQKCLFEFTQGGTGSYTVSFTSETKYGTDLTAFTPSTTVGITDFMGIIYSTINSKYNVVSYARGY